MRKQKNLKALTLIELMIAVAICVIPLIAIGQILTGHKKDENKMWSAIQSQTRIDSQRFTIIFGAIGRRANRKNYTLYNVDKSTFTPALPNNTAGQNIEGDAVEFIYWDQEFNENNSEQLMDTSSDGTRYAIFYPSNGQLKVDYGPYPPKSISGGSKKAAERTEVVIHNLESVKFSHYIESGAGKGCVRATVVIRDPDTNKTTEIKVATLIRNIWPR